VMPARKKNLVRSPIVFSSFGLTDNSGGFASALRSFVVSHTASSCFLGVIQTADMSVTA